MQSEERPNVLIGTPAYGGQVHIDYVHALMDFFREQIRFRVFTIGNESLITRARNTIVSAFYQSTAYTHLLFLDGDVHLTGRGLLTLLERRRPVIGAPVALKSVDAGGNKRPNYHGELSQDGDLLTVEGLGTAVLLLERAAVNALVEDAAGDGRVYEYPMETERGTHTVVNYDVFQVGVAGRTYLSEDFWVCRRLRQLGYEIVVDLSVGTMHYGNQRF